MEFHHIEGDLIALAQAGSFDVIAHGCNCFCTMGAGIVKSIKAHFPQAFDADCQTAKGDKEKLGTCSTAACPIEDGRVVTVVNAYTQHHYRGQGPLVSYDAIRSCMGWINRSFAGQNLGLPHIGAGLAGGDWEQILAICREELTDLEVTIVTYRAS